MKKDKAINACFLLAVLISFNVEGIGQTAKVNIVKLEITKNVSIDTLRKSLRTGDARSATGNAQVRKTFRIQFDSNEEVSGQKFAIEDISPGLSSNWDDYNYVVLEFKSSTAQRFHVGFTTDNGYNEVRVMSYVANGWKKLAIPLKFYRYVPGAAADLAATYNQPRYTGWINLSGKRGPLHGVDSIGIRMLAPINNPSFEIRSISLSIDDPGDEYLEKIPAVDEFGQSNLIHYDRKIESLDQLRKEWQAEDSEIVSSPPFQYSKYGGYLNARVEGSGFFRTKKIDGRWWFVDPDGYLFLSVGVDCIRPGGAGNVRDVEVRSNIFKELPPEEFWFGRRQGSGIRTPSFGLWNLYRRYGEGYREKSLDMIIRRMEKWGINTIANWSDGELIAKNKKAFMLQLHGIGVEHDLMGLADVYDPAFTSRVEQSIKNFVEPLKDNPWLIGYFTANEPVWGGQEDRLCSLIVNGAERPIRSKLVTYLAQEDTPGRRKEFIQNTFRIFLATVDNAVQKYDRNHLNLGIRFGGIDGIDPDIGQSLERIYQLMNLLLFHGYPPGRSYFSNDKGK